MKFSYKKFPDGTLRPVIPTILSVGDQRVPYEILIDSGSDECIFDSGIGRLLGINVESGMEFIVMGISGHQQSYFLHEINIDIGGWRYSVRVGFVQEMPVANLGIVGHKGFFDLFKIIFDYRKEEIELRPYPIS